MKKEADEGHQLYVRSHGSYFVGQSECSPFRGLSLCLNFPFLLLLSFSCAYFGIISENADGQVSATFVSLLLQESVWTESTIAITIGEIVGLVSQHLITMMGEPSPDLCGGPVTH